MSFEAAIASAGGDDTVLAKSFIIAAEEDALNWYSMFKPRIIYSWENLREKILSNFHGFKSESLTTSNLFHWKQSQAEQLKDIFPRFIHLKSRGPNVPEEVVIEATIKVLKLGPFAAHLAKEKSTSLEQLYIH